MTDNTTALLHEPHSADSPEEADVKRVLLVRLAQLDRNMLYYLACALEGHPRVKHLAHKAIRDLLTDSELHNRLYGKTNTSQVAEWQEAQP